jgi:hypothetical protein
VASGGMLSPIIVLPYYMWLISSLVLSNMFGAQEGHILMIGLYGQKHLDNPSFLNQDSVKRNVTTCYSQTILVATVQH